MVRPPVRARPAPPSAPRPTPQHLRPDIRKFAFVNEHPEWAWVADEALHQGTGLPGDLLYRVAVALKLAYDMGLRGEAVPRPRHLGERRIPELEVDPGHDPLYSEIQQDAWPDADTDHMSAREMKRRRMARVFDQNQQKAQSPA